MKFIKKTTHHSLGFYLAIWFSFLSILLTFILLVVIDVTVTKQAKSSIGTNLADLAYQMSYRLDRAMFERYREVQLMAERIGRDGQSVSGPENREALDALQRTYPHYAWIGATDNEGKVLMATGGLLERADVSARPWFQNAKKGIHVGDVHKAKLLSALLPNNTGESSRFVDIAFPYAGTSVQAQGVLGAHLSWAWAQDIQRSIIEPVDKERKLDAMILSADNTVLLGPPALQGQTLALRVLQDLKQGLRGFRTELLPDGREYLVGFSQGQGYGSYPGLGWKVLVRQSREDAYLPVKQLQLQVLWIGIAVASLFLLLGFGAARFITRPLKALSRSAQQLEAGQPAQIDAVGVPYTEVKNLSESLNSLISNLQQKESALKDLNVTLENRVEQRTIELTQALEGVRDSENRTKTIIETAQGAFIGVNFEGRITDWNSQAQKMLGWTREEMLGQSLVKLVPERFRADIDSAMQHFVHTGTASFINTNLERLVLTKEGKELPVEVRIGLINTPKLKFFSAFLHDISERKQVERMKNEFISTASHELRTPLTAIYASLSLVNSGMAGELPPDAQELLGISFKSAERLVRLVNEVLDVEKIDSQTMDYRMVTQAMLPLVEQAVRATQHYADQYGVRLELAGDSADGQVSIDVDRIIQVVVNLLSNAAKFSPAGGLVRVSLKQFSAYLRVSVIDSGTGIPENFRDRIFQRFAQADSSDRRQKGGTGLGLNICKSIIEAHKGRIDFVSEAGKGCEFYFDLPIAAQGRIQVWQ
ncbi:sensor histidine kinase [Polaromonas sp.]|uniref:sensor histidine kinase n=1 Tax=Polaromonas sp. TaxID=1869339 RepID=UPI001D695F90|nr:sensor histidine kinase [Polaromonas sp.]MBT9477000.1 PAS domain S-box protein [Polaromonas sp.]